MSTDEANIIACPACGTVYGVGSSPFCRDGHGRWLTSSAPNFAPYDDVGLGVHVESPDHRRRVMKANKLEYRDKMRPGDLSARRDKVEQQKRQQGR